MEMTKLSCEKFLAELASKAPTPGGGGTAALVGAAGVALGNMVGNLTTGKKKYAAVEADIQALNTKADFLRKELEVLVQADADAFAPLAAANSGSTVLTRPMVSIISLYIIFYPSQFPEKAPDL